MVFWEEHDMTEHTRKPITRLLVMGLVLLAAAMLSGCGEEKAAEQVTPTPSTDHTATILDQDRTTEGEQPVIDPSVGETESDVVQAEDLPDPEEPEYLACTIAVDAGESIQEAIDAAPAGAVICLGAGTWRENLVIGKALTLRGAGAEATTIQGLVAGEHVLSIASHTEIQVTIKELTVTGAHGTWAYGIRLARRAQCTIEDVFVERNVSNGVYVMDSARATIVGSSVMGNQGMGIVVQEDAQAEIRGSTVEGNGGDGLSLKGSAEVTLADTVVRGNGGDGVAVSDTNRVTIARSIIEANVRDGLSVRQSFGSTIQTQLTVTDTTILASSGYGIAMYGTTVITLTECAVLENGRSGILLTQAAEAAIVDTRVTGNGGRGIIVQSSAGLSVEGSSIRGNELQGVFMSGTARASFQGSTIDGNGSDGLFVRDSAEATVERSEFAANGNRGIALFEQPCFDGIEDVFTGYIAGFGNRIPGPDQEDGNMERAVCPDALVFLMTEEGGEFDRRELAQPTGLEHVNVGDFRRA